MACKELLCAIKGETDLMNLFRKKEDSSASMLVLEPKEGNTNFPVNNPILTN